MRSLIAEFPSIVQMYEAMDRDMTGEGGGAMSERDRERQFERFCAEIFSQLLIHQSTEREKEKQKEKEGEEEEEGADEDRLRKKEEKEEEEKLGKIRETRENLETQNSELSFTQGEGGGETLPSCSGEGGGETLPGGGGEGGSDTLPAIKVDVKRMRTSLEAEMRRVRVQTVDDFVETQLQVSCRC
jgi:hypothetical protein